MSNNVMQSTSYPSHNSLQSLPSNQPYVNTLVVNYDPQDVSTFRSVDQQLIITKQAPGQKYPVAWLSIPILQLNRITWSEKYILYASRTDYRPHTIIHKESRTVPQPLGTQFSFRNGVFTRGNDPGEYGGYTINYDPASDLDEKILTFGLASPECLVNDKNIFDAPAVSAAPVLLGETITITPLEVIQVFMQSRIFTGQVLSVVTSNALTLDYTGYQNYYSIRWVGTGFVIESDRNPLRA